MPVALTTRARAKVNLDLKILGRRADGYHELKSLVAFASVGDSLALEPASGLGLTIGGPQGTSLVADDGNLVLRAVQALADELPGLRTGHFHLVKRLPVASGIGGGSADAAATLRLLARLNGLSPASPQLQRAAIRVGADVLVCLESRARIMAGIGERLGPALCLPPLFAILVNPNVAVGTADVFRTLGLAQGQSCPAAVESGIGAAERFAAAPDLLAALHRTGNDLEAPAAQVAPIITDVLQRLSRLPGYRLGRMSGSGATCFALFDDCRQSAAAAKLLADERPDWWIKPTLLR
ncbi:4-(cytidine 5'-diphospho)-2-C-methyl-D-erythritol kinase [Bosea sp. 2RAB26]|uniref:4-(cytidine 5'-diphospho)-2-C-methyl-D-erythritol kinase n=1 Tax=Bosea sp. 2RAB26 TaxID=3237476 RepID=UPI003F8F2435